MSLDASTEVLTLERAKEELNKAHYDYQSAQVNRITQGRNVRPEFIGKEELTASVYLACKHTYMLAKTAVDEEYALRKINSLTRQRDMTESGCKAIEQVHGLNGSTPESKALLASYVSKVKMLSSAIEQIRRNV